MAKINRAIVERTWGLHWFQQLYSFDSVSSGDSKLAYGPRFRYEEFVSQKSVQASLLLSLSVAIMAAGLVLLPPVRLLLLFGVFLMISAHGLLF
jgi:hypothetical protein